MSRPRQRARLEDGLRLDLNRLARLRLVVPGALTLGRHIHWHYVYADETVTNGLLDADMSEESGWLRIKVGQLDQRVALVSQPRRFGGRQWYFACPRTSRRASVLWLPPGATRFASRHAWPRQVAYGSQFETRHGRSLGAAQSIRARLGGAFWAPLDGLDPPRPKWMRARTYRRLLERSWRYESIADERLVILAARWMKG